jgi:thymidylate kinase
MINSCKRVTIFEGPDGGGKTTTARTYARHTHAQYVHFGNLPIVTHGLARMYVEAMLPALLGYQPVVLDRCWLSEVPYGKAFRGGMDRLGTPTRRMLERLAMRCSAVVVQCQPSLETCLSNFNRRRHEEMLRREEELTEVYMHYLEEPTALPKIMFDFTSNLKLEDDLQAEIKAAQDSVPRHHLHVASAGHLNARVMLVGERFANHKNDDPFYQWPFASFDQGGCSQWLTQQLEDAGIGEELIYWVNADKIKESMLYHRLPDDLHVVALGGAADVLLDELAITHHTVDHPQAHKRFHAKEPYPLISLLKEVLQ